MRFHNFILSVIAASTFHCGLANSQNFEAPKFDVGDKWTYSYRNIGDRKDPYTYTHQVFKADADSGWLYAESQASNPNRRSWISRFDFKRGGIKESFEYNPQTPGNPNPIQPGNRYKETLSVDDEIQYPLFVGKKYKLEMPAVNGGSSYQYTVMVDAFEKVTTPAGQFDVYKLTFEGYWNRLDGIQSYNGSTTRVSWVAPNVKRIVRTEYQDRTNRNRLFNQWVEELVKWEPKATVPPGIK